MIVKKTFCITHKRTIPPENIISGIESLRVSKEKFCKLNIKITRIVTIDKMLANISEHLFF